MRTSLLIISLILLAACSPKKDFKRLDTLVSKTDRFLAKDTNFECFSESLKEDQILREIKILESQKHSQSRSIIYGLDLSKFSSSEASFIEKTKEYVQIQGLDVNECRDVKCLFSKIYPNSNGLEGYIHYYFYLQSGYALNTVKSSVPKVTLPPEKTHVDILFSNEELQHFYFLGKLLTPPFKHLSNLQNISRLPKYNFLPDYKNACGLAGGFANSGYIILMDKCLTIEKDSILQGEFIESAFHEISHRLDYKLAKERFSETKAWLDLSGWTLKENIDPTTGKVTTRQWAVKESSAGEVDGFVRDYSSTNPGEDFADSVGHFRAKPEQLFSVSPRKFSWISMNLFQNKSFTSDGLTKAYAGYLKSFTMSSIPSIVQGCLTDKSSYLPYDDPGVVSSFNEYDGALIQCILGGIDQNITQGIKNLKREEPEACSYFSSSDKSLRSRVFLELVDFVKSDLSKNIEIATSLALVSEAMNKVQEEIDPREIFMSCQENTQQLECFNKVIKEELDKQTLSYKAAIPNQIANFEQTYLKDNSYEFVKSKIVELFGQVFVGVEMRFKKEAERKWEICKNANNITDDEAPFFSLFSGGSQYIDRSILNCLNQNAEKDLLKILDNASRKLGLSISNEAIMKFVLGLYVPRFTGTLQDLLNREVKAESTEVLKIKRALNQQVVTSMIAHPAWITASTSDEIETRKNCEVEANVRGIKLLESAYADKLSQFKYHNRSDVLGVEEICNEVVSSQAVKSVYLRNKEIKLKASLIELENLVLDKASAYSKTCKSQYPKKDWNSTRNRKNCLLKADRWKSFVTSALEEWSSEDSKLGVRYLESKKSELQDRAIKAMEA